MPVRAKQTLNDRVAEQLRDKIISQEYMPGAKLPNEYQLAEEYDVCRYTVREAVKKLVATGLVTVWRGRGTYVNERIPANYFKPLMEILILGDKDINEIFEARLAIEQKAASLAAANAQLGQIEEMEALLEQMEASLGEQDIKTYNRLDYTLHNQIAHASKNRLLCQVLHILQDLVQYTIEQAAVNLEKQHKSMQGHREIIKAIRERSPQEAGQRMMEHLSYCQKLF